MHGPGDDYGALGLPPALNWVQVLPELSSWPNADLAVARLVSATHYGLAFSSQRNHAALRMAELAAAQERRTAELDAIAAIYGDDVCSRSENSISVRVDGVLVVNLVLPDGYPGRAAPIVDIDAAQLPRAVRTDVAQKLSAFCEEEECVLALLQEAGACYAAATEPASVVSEPTAPPVVYCVIVIDHMNDARPYAERLKRWAGGLRAVLFSRLAPTAAAPSRREGAVLVLQGDDALIGSLLTSLRAEPLDRDRRGRPCKERQAKVLRRSAMTPADVALAEPWREVTYDGGRAAGDALVERCVGGDCR